MPLHLVRNNATAMAVDAVVELTDMNDRSPAPGEVVSEPRPGQDRGYVFNTAVTRQDHTVMDEDAVRTCYRVCMHTAAAHGCASVAFPLIGADVPGFPKDRLLGIAYDELLSCLCVYEADVYLAVPDKGSFSIGKTLLDSVRSYIDEMTPRTPESAAADGERPQKTAGRRLSRRETISGAAPNKRTAYAAAPVQHFKEEALCEERAACEYLADDTADQSLEDLLHHMDVGFSLRLQLLIDRKGMSDVDCYKRANVSKQTWYKILNDPDYRPSKTTVLCFAVALHLSLTETQTLLATAGYALSHSSKADIIVEYFLSRGIYDFAEIDGTLLQFDQPTLGAYT